MDAGAGGITVHNPLKVAPWCGERALTFAYNNALVLTAVLNQISNAANLQLMFFGKLQQVRQPCHTAIVFHDLANDSSRRAVRQCGEITTGLRMSGANEYAARLCH